MNLIWSGLWLRLWHFLVCGLRLCYCLWSPPLVSLILKMLYCIIGFVQMILLVRKLSWAVLLQPQSDFDCLKAYICDIKWLLWLNLQPNQAIGKSRPDSRIKPPVYVSVRRNIMYEKAAFLAGNGVRKISSVACCFSSIKTQYSVHRIKEVCVFNKLLKNLNCIYSILWNVLTVCFVATKLDIVLAWFLWRQRHAMWRQLHIIKVDPRCTFKVWFLGIARGSSDCQKGSTESPGPHTKIQLSLI